ncbi:MAG: hypothetical protein LBU79_02170 [Planctomycetota bacterium]|jgi:ABC-type uncharacterized transport system substrate-binding protein|nr:hypothetical protein [Planctomycetota bacterium]
MSRTASSCLAVFCLTLLTLAGAAEPKRVAYFESGPFWLFSNTMLPLKTQLLEMEDFSVTFPEELHFSPGWDASPTVTEEIAANLMARDDVDLIIAAGTTVVRELLRQNNGRTPIIGIGMADPLAAGVVESPDDSGIDNFTCLVVVDRWKQMIRVFHDLVGFSTLGMIYPPGPEGRLYSAVDDAKEVAAELGFQVLEQEIPDEYTPACSEGIKWLNEHGADAIFIGPLICFDWELSDLTPLLDQINRLHKMPSFARDGSLFVQSGVLMGFATWDFTLLGRRMVNMINLIFQGEKARSLPMRINMEPLISINLETAKEIGYDPPFDVLVAADEIYTVSKKPATAPDK